MQEKIEQNLTRRSSLFVNDIEIRKWLPLKMMVYADLKLLKG